MPQELEWEVLPAERPGQSVLAHPKAFSILKAYIGGATKAEIARVFGLRESLVRRVIEAAARHAASTANGLT
jgi:hypothetical protein